MKLCHIILLHLILLSLTSCSSASKEEQVVTKETTSASDNIQGLYFGSEDINSDSELGWVIYLDNKNSEGIMYDPPYGILTIKDIKLTPTGGITFNALNKNDGKIQYAFNGGINTEKISGTLINSSNNSVKVKFEKIFPDSISSAQHSDIGTIFSNIYYNDEGGDLLGDEVLILHG